MLACLELCHHHSLTVKKDLYVALGRQTGPSETIQSAVILYDPECANRVATSETRNSQALHLGRAGDLHIYLSRPFTDERLEV